MAYDPEGSPEERAAEVRETFHFMSLADLRGAEFLRLLRLAHTEGLLTELLQAAGCVGHQAGSLAHRHFAGSICDRSEHTKLNPFRRFQRVETRLAKRIRMVAPEIVVSTCSKFMRLFLSFLWAISQLRAV